MEFELSFFASNDSLDFFNYWIWQIVKTGCIYFTLTINNQFNYKQWGYIQFNYNPWNYIQFNYNNPWIYIQFNNYKRTFSFSCKCINKLKYCQYGLYNAKSNYTSVSCNQTDSCYKMQTRRQRCIKIWSKAAKKKIKISWVSFYDSSFPDTQHRVSVLQVRES